MNSYVLALGSNTGDRLSHLSEALRQLKALGAITAVSPAIENPPWLEAGAPAEWYQFFLNACVILETALSPMELLHKTQIIEKNLGRPADHARWAPRALDIDILFELHGQSYQSSALTLPHPQWKKRNFVLSPLSTILPRRRLSDIEVTLNPHTVLSHYRENVPPLPALMAIVNVTPDSFSNPKRTIPTEGITTESLLTDLSAHFEQGAAYIDIGAESTRPGATALTADEEWARLLPLLTQVRELKERYPFTKISLDTYHAETAQKALDYKVDILNDVTGLSSSAMQEVAQDYSSVIVMHSLSVPAKKEVVWPPSINPISELKGWLQQKLETLPLAPEKVIWDPGLGFGKTPLQSLEIIKNFHLFKDLPCRSLVGASRKSFMNLWTAKSFEHRDIETLAASQQLVAKGADILRVHNLSLHQEFFKSHMALTGESNVYL